jgi:CHAT domain-containing protein
MLMAVRLNNRSWNFRRAATSRGAGVAIAGLPPEFVPENATTEEFVATARPAARGERTGRGTLDVSVDLSPGEAAVLALRQPSGALTFHAPRPERRRARGGPGEARFVVSLPLPVPGEGAATRGIASAAVKAVVIKVVDRAVDAAAGRVLSKLASVFEHAVWSRRKLREGWLAVTKQSLADGRLAAAKPTSEERSLLLIHGTFSNTASAFRALARTTFFEDVGPLYQGRIFAFDHFTVSRTPEENVRMLLAELPDKRFHFDVITHSRGGLVLRSLVERSTLFGALASRFTLGRAVLVAAPNQGTPLATPSRWENTVGWVANLLELFPDNPFTTGAEFVANGIVWIARHASGDLPGIHAMDRDSDLIRALQSPPGPPSDHYSVLTANYTPEGSVLRRLLDVGLDQLFDTANDLVVPAEGGWRVDRSGAAFAPGARIGCFGPGGNIGRGDVTHVNLFAQPETVPFLVAALADRAQALEPLDVAQPLPDRRLVRAGAPALAPPVATAGPVAVVRARPHVREARAVVSGQPRLIVTVLNGDLTFEEQPLLVGHYRATRLTGTEKVLDRLLDRAMSHSLDLGVYPVEPGTHRIFVNRGPVPAGRFWQRPRPQAVIVAGLGQEGKLQSAHLVHTVRQAVLAWAERVAEDEPRAADSILASTLLASGGTGITPGQAAQLIAQGVHEANELIRRTRDRRRLPEVRELRFVELFLSRATEAWEALKMLAFASPERYTVGEPIVEGAGALRRPLVSGYRGADYDFISAETRQDANGNSFVAYALATNRARTEVRAQATQARLLRDLVATASSELNTEQQVGRTLYNLLVPTELEAFLASSGETQIEVDSGTAGIPWELLDDTTAARADRLPWAIRAKLLRKFRTESYRTQVNDADTEASVLVIGEPQCPAGYPPLPGALEEARQVFTLLTSAAGLDTTRVHKLFADGQAEGGPDARQIVDTLFERSWRVVHIAGHGEPVSAAGDRGGVVLSNDTFLGASEIKAMRVVPELVFVNCCHLAAGAPRALLGDVRDGGYDRAAFASSVAQALIEVGVRCVVAAGWAVDDTAASVFATTFYQALLGGQRFIDAVAAAREKAFEHDGNTWAAYQCYGDPDWTFRRQTAWGRSAERARPGEFDSVGSLETLELALDTLIVESTFQGTAPEVQLDRLRQLEERWTRMRWAAPTPIAERFARAYASANDLASAIRWYETAVESGDGQVSFRVLEQASNLRIRHAVEAARASIRERDGLSITETPSRAEVTARWQTAIAAARETIDREMRRLEQLSAFQQTAERESLRGSAMKRLAMLEASADATAAVRHAVETMRTHYARAVDLARDGDGVFYPALNVIAADLVLSRLSGRSRRPARRLFDQARRSIAAKNKTAPDFWSLVAEPELRLYEALSKGKLPGAARSIVASFGDVFDRSRAGHEVRSVADSLHFVLDAYASGRGPQSKAARKLLADIEQHIRSLQRA